MNRLSPAIALLALLLAAAGCSTTLPGTPLTIDTASFQLVPGSCAGVGLRPFRIERDGDTLRYMDVDTEAAVRVVWPNGFAARLLNGIATLYTSNGGVVAREHEVVENAGGCPRSDGSILVESW